jgi:aspartate/methionine/tyrosine aminotransferase
MIQVNKNILQLKPSATLAINQKVKELRDMGEKVCHFGFGQSPFKIHHSISEELKQHVHNNHYLPSTGLPELKKEIAIFLSTYQEVKFESNSIFIGPGSKELLYQLIYLLEGIFFIPQASWVSYRPQIKTKDALYKIITTKALNNYKLEAHDLEIACKKNLVVQKTLILNSPNNPTGAVYSDEEVRAIARVCRKYDLIVFSDEIYSQINFDEDFSPSIAKYYPEKTIVFGGLSKVFSAGGYRLGFAAIPTTMKQIYKPLLSFFSETFSAVSSPIQFAAIKAFQMNSQLSLYIKDCTQVLKGISIYVYNELVKMQIKCTQPMGAFYMIIDFENFRDKLKNINLNNAIELSDYLILKYKIALLPGQDFYFDQNSLTFRLAFVDFDGDKAYHAYKLNQVIDSVFVKKNAENMYHGLKKLEAFLLEI